MSHTPQLILQAYDAHIQEAASDLQQLKDVRFQIRQQHDRDMKAKQDYLVHLKRKIKSRLQRGGDVTTYSRVMEEIYKSMHKSDRPVNDVLRRQSLLLSVTHQCEVLENLVALCHTQNKQFAESLMKDISDMEDEKAQTQIIFAKRSHDRLLEMEQEKQSRLDRTINPQRMVIYRLENMDKLSTMTDLQAWQDQMAQVRNRQSKSFQEKLKEKSEHYKQMGRDSFSQARRHSISSFAGSFGGSKSQADNAANKEDCPWGDDDKSVWSARSGWSAKTGRSQKYATTNFVGRLLRRASATFGSETALAPPFEICIGNKPPSSSDSTFMLLNGLSRELDASNELDVDLDDTSIGSNTSDTAPDLDLGVPPELILDMKIENCDV